MSPGGDEGATGPSPWLWATVVGAFVGLVIAIVLFVPFSNFQAYVPPGVEGCGSGWTNAVGTEFCGDFPTWVAVVAGLLGIVAGWGVVVLVRRLVGSRS